MYAFIHMHVVDVCFAWSPQSNKTCAHGTHIYFNNEYLMPAICMQGARTHVRGRSQNMNFSYSCVFDFPFSEMIECIHVFYTITSNNEHIQCSLLKYSIWYVTPEIQLDSIAYSILLRVHCAFDATIKDYVSHSTVYSTSEKFIFMFSSRHPFCVTTQNRKRILK